MAKAKPRASKDKGNGDYQADSIQVLKGLEAVRRRPAMYIGSVSGRGLHHLVYEVVDNSVDEALAGYSTQIDVTVHTDNAITVVDNGRGIPADIHKTEKKPGVEVALTVLHAGGKFDKSTYKVSGGLHGVGVSVVNALSEKLEVWVDRDGKRHHMAFERGKTTEKLEVIGKAKGTGTTVWFKPDTKIFTETRFDYATIATRLRELAFLNKALTITLKDERKGQQKEETFFYKGGLAEFVKHLLGNRKSLHPKPIAFETTREGVVVEEGRPPQEGRVHSHGGRHPRRPDRGAARQSEGPAIRGSDQDQARQLRGRGGRKDRGQRRPGRFFRQEPERGTYHHREGAERRPGARGGPKGARAGPQEERARGRLAPREARRLLGLGPQAHGAVPRRGRFCGRLGQAGPRPQLPGDPPAAGQDPQRAEGPDRQDPLERGDPHDHYGHRHGCGRRFHAGRRALPQDHHHDGRRRGRRPHPHAAPHVLLQGDEVPDRRRIHL